jgi:hypothetical protein|nr:hypothetical protein [Oxalobacteraceae bacterium]
MIIGVCGLIGSGKDTIADYLVNVHQFRRDSFAASLKDAVSAVFGWERELLEGRTRHSREWREQVDPWWAQRLGMADLTPRWVLQNWGTEVCRRGFHEDIWVASVENKIRRSQDDIVISDCRFPNEVAALRRSGGHVIRVIRGNTPEWWPTAVTNPDLMGQLHPQVHASEWAWAGTNFDRVIPNHGTLDELYAGINDLVRDLRAAKASHSY